MQSSPKNITINTDQKMKTTMPQLLAAALVAAVVIGTATPRPAQACNACTNRVEIKIPEQAADVLKILHEHDAALAATVKDKKLSPVSHLVSTMSVYARALPGKAAPDRKEAATNAMTSFRLISKELLRAGILEKQADAVTQASRLHAALNLFDACFDDKPSAAPQAKPEEPSHTK